MGRITSAYRHLLNGTLGFFVYAEHADGTETVHRVATVDPTACKNLVAEVAALHPDYENTVK